MSDNEKPVDIASIEARLVAATGPWNLEIEDKEGFLVALGTAMGKPRWSIFALKDEGQADIDFIGNSYTDIAALLGEIHRLRGFEYHMRQIGYPIDDNAYNCLICDELTSSVVEMLRHMKVQHQPKE